MGSGASADANKGPTPQELRDAEIAALEAQLKKKKAELKKAVADAESEIFGMHTKHKERVELHAAEKAQEKDEALAAKDAEIALREYIVLGELRCVEEQKSQALSERDAELAAKEAAMQERQRLREALLIDPRPPSRHASYVTMCLQVHAMMAEERLVALHAQAGQRS